ncbi:inositol-pentakisphosphate 2-kinase-domain-containing protein [Phyllosticta paracitricarpa]|uniref:Inositol-pentakisphosphate 2-kinase n=1 Tax=Phyllosticta paracitricarpa TaxID=2016321 RepID=A0ABR1NJN5_9PEZI
MSSFLPAYLDPIQVDLRFLAEGNANVIYRIAPVRATHNSASHADTFDKLIQLDAHKILEPDWRYSHEPERQRMFNRDMAKQKHSLIKSYEDVGLQHAAADFVTRCTRADLTGASKDMLLRLKKKVPFYQDDRTTYDFYLNTISDWIPQRHLVQQDLIRISNDIIENCNSELRTREKSGQREPKRHGTYLHLTDSAIIMRDMNSYDAEKSVTLEFKPKWLWQSPTAPPNATRCRTCALRAQRKSKGEKESKTHGVLCPLVISTGEPDYIRDVVTQLVDNPSNYVGTALPRWLADTHATNGTNGQTHDNGPKSRHDLIEKLCRHFSADSHAALHKRHGEGYHVLQGLQHMQRRLDQCGILDREPTPDFLLAMTLRDCSLYVQVHWDSQRVESRLGDLDPKVSKGGKLEQWRETEKSLLDGGWYIRGSLAKTKWCPHALHLSNYVRMVQFFDPTDPNNPMGFMGSRPYNSLECVDALWTAMGDVVAGPTPACTPNWLWRTLTYYRGREVFKVINPTDGSPATRDGFQYYILCPTTDSSA